MTVRVQWAGDASVVVRESEKVRTSAQKVDAAYKAIEQETRALERAAKQLWTNTQTPLERYNEKVKVLETLYGRVHINHETYKRGLAEATAELRGHGNTSTNVFSSVAMDLKGIAAGWFSIQGAIAATSTVANDYEKNIKKIADAARAGADDVIAFAALQEPGTSRERSLRVLRASAGVSKPGEALMLTQAMQSAKGGDFDAGLAAASEVWAGARVGVPVDLGQELEIQGALAGMKPGELSRWAYIAGQASARDPAAVAKMAPALRMFEDKLFGVAFGAKIAESFGSQRAETYSRSAASALQQTGPLEKFWQKQGIGIEATNEERIKALLSAGITDQKTLGLAGVKDVEKQQALGAILEEFGDVDKYRNTIKSKMAAGDVFAADVKKIEAQHPEVAFDKKMQEMTDLRDMAMKMGGRTPQERAIRMGQAMYRRTLGKELTERGVDEGWFGRNFVDEEGDAISGFWGWRRRLAGVFDSDIREAQDAAMSEQVRTFRTTLQAFEQIEKSSKKTAENTERVSRPRIPAPE